MKLSLPRLSCWLLITVVVTFLIGLLAPQQLPVTLYKLSLVCLAAVLGYWIDRSVFPYARPHEALTKSYCHFYQVRRAILMAAVILAIALGA